MNSEPSPISFALNPTVAALILLILTVGVYAPTMSDDFGFIWDDDYYILKNPTFREEGGLSKIWNPWQDDREIHPVTKQYYPVTYTALWLEYQFASKAGGVVSAQLFHMVNLFLHIAVALLLWRVCTLLGMKSSYWIALIFALHPVATESVAWVTEHKNTLSALFALGAICLYLQYALKETPKNVMKQKWYLLFLLLFVLALLSKSVTSVLPLVLVVLLWWKKEDFTWRDSIPLLPLFVLGAVSGVMTIIMEIDAAGARTLSWDGGPLERFQLMGRTPLFYISKLAWPAELAFFYERWQISGSDLTGYVFPVVSLGLLVLLWKLKKHVGKGPLVGLLVFYIGLIPASGLFNVYPFKFSFVADHFQYHAMMGMLALMVSLVAYVIERFVSKNEMVKVFAFIVMTVLCLYQTSDGLGRFQNLQHLWEDTIVKTPSSWAAHEELGNVYFSQGEFGRAKAHFIKSLNITDNVEKKSLIGIGAIYDAMASQAAAQKQTQKAQTYFEEAEHYYMRYLDEVTEDLFVLSKLASVMTAQGQHQQAEAYYKKMIQKAPQVPQYHVLLGINMIEQKSPEMASEKFFDAVKMIEKQVQGGRPLSMYQDDLNELLWRLKRLQSQVEVNALLQRVKNLNASFGFQH